MTGPAGTGKTYNTENAIKMLLGLDHNDCELMKKMENFRRPRVRILVTCKQNAPLFEMKKEFEGFNRIRTCHLVAKKYENMKGVSLELDQTADLVFST